ncbi:hypothetical protein EJ03DRAFT_44847 [Teratosphaeria nubilosa]|uniref:Rhodopsin domain-containing protein n=1 Tax=Teratosphaeria nubilosa TaxID=161662 RepID=A0A6G1LFX6_9PEZI|nr:hypothetical protein EJ03DRAFT_44847 [Teratosphaeria nubilosa]
MRLPPLDILLTWPTPNYEHPKTHGPALLCVNLIFITLVIIAVLGRFYSRIVVKKWYGADDTMCALALLCTIGMTVVVILANEKFGWNRHEWDVSASMVAGANKIAFVAKLMFSLAATFTRLSLIIFYFRLIKDSSMPWFRWVLHASWLWTVAVCIIFVCETIWLCVPTQAYWELLPKGPYRCLNEGTVMLAGGIINCVSDLLTTVLPIPIIAKLQMPLKQKIGVGVLLSLGLIVTIAGIVRTVFIWESLIARYDETWYSYPLWIAAAIEIDLAVICACAPSWKSLLKQPLINCSLRISSKISSIRSPHHSQHSQTSTTYSSSNGKSSIFKPLRSAAWPHISKPDSEKERSSSSRWPSSQDLEKGLHDPVELGAEGHQIETRADAGARDFRHSQLCMDDDEICPRSPPTPTLRIMKRQSVEQECTYICPTVCPSISTYSSSPRRSIGSLLPGQWLGEGSAKKFFPTKR